MLDSTQGPIMKSILLARLPVLFAVLSVSFSALVGCGDSDHEVSIEVRTDFLPLDEFDAIQLTIDSTRESVAMLGGDYLEGERIYDGELSPGDHEVLVALTRAGRTLVSRSVLFRVDTDRGMTVVLTRSCADVMCGANTTCISGACMDPQCTPETPEFCEARECESDDGCTAGRCGAAACVSGSCFQYDDGLCEGDAFCVPTTGCLSRDADAGPGMDAMTLDVGAGDGGLDVGPGSDGGPVDVGPGDAGPSDTGRDVPPPQDTGGPDVSGPTGDCINPGDTAILEPYTVQRGIGDGTACYQIHGNNPSAIQSCVQARVPISDMCADCIVQIVQCTVAFCSTPCMVPSSAACTTCRDSNCDEPFNDCSGFNI